MFQIQNKKITVVCLYLVLNAIEGSRTPPVDHLGKNGKALIGTKQLAVSGQPIDDAAKEVPDQLKDNTGIGQTMDSLEHLNDHLNDISVSEKEVRIPERRIPLPQISKISGAMILQSIISIFMAMICTLLCAFGYDRVKTDSRYSLGTNPLGYSPQAGEEHSQDALKRGTWRWGLFECFGDIKICMISCICPCIRWSDTMRMAGLMGFWIAIILMSFLYALSPFVGGISSLIMLAIVTYRRQELRKLFRMNSDGTTWCEDCCTYMWCSCCAIVQEARQLEEAYAVGYPLAVIKEYPASSSRSQQRQPQPQLSDRLPMPPPASQPLPPPPGAGYPMPPPAPQPLRGAGPPMSMQPMMSMGPPMAGPPMTYQSMPPRSVQSLGPGPPMQMQAQPQFASMGPPMGQPMPMGTPPGSIQSMGPTTQM